MKEIKVKIDGLLIVQYATRDEAEHLVNHFIELERRYKCLKIILYDF